VAADTYQQRTNAVEGEQYSFIFLRHSSPVFYGNLADRKSWCILLRNGDYYKGNMLCLAIYRPPALEWKKSKDIEDPTYD
jgi:hypothetical protein